jgi:gas vesicle protein
MSSGKVWTAIIGFTVGALVGAGIALMTAPMSGKELQYRIRKEIDLESATAQPEYHKNLAQLQKRIDSLKARAGELTSS